MVCWLRGPLKSWFAAVMCCNVWIWSDSAILPTSIVVLGGFFQIYILTPQISFICCGSTAFAIFVDWLKPDYVQQNVRWVLSIILNVWKYVMMVAVWKCELIRASFGCHNGLPREPELHIWLLQQSALVAQPSQGFLSPLSLKNHRPFTCQVNSSIATLWS